MIPRADITEWRNNAPWKFDWQVEQDLVMARALVDLFSNEHIGQQLAFRGGTALHKLFFPPPSRYSEDIDLVQIQQKPIGDIIDTVRDIFDPTFGKPKIAQSRDSQLLIYRVQSEIPPIVPLRLKIEINSREHFNVFGLKRQSFEVKSRWFSGSCNISTFEIDELLGTKLRALYQRRKGRDLFDLWFALTKGIVNPARIVEVFQKYLAASGHKVSRNEFKDNLISKMNNHAFLHDTDAILRPGISYNPREAFELVLVKLVNII